MGLSNDQFFQWGQTGQPASGQAYNDNRFAMNAASYPQTNPENVPQSSNQLTRRPMSQLTSLVPQPNQEGSGWAENKQGVAQPPEGDWGDDIADLEARAMVAKREAQSKRKQIPPFVQKLNR
jgi:heat shock transcription factor, other eukaryote